MSGTALLFLGLTASSYPDSFQILGPADQLLETEAQKSAALSSGYQPNLQWQSFSQWQCFPSRIVYISLEKVDRFKLPYMEVKTQNRYFVFSLTPRDLDQKPVYQKWTDFKVQSADLCIFAAKLPAKWHSSESELWYVDRVKTRAGEWVLDEESI